MLYSIESREDLQNLNDLISLNNQVKSLRFQDKLGKQNFHDDMKKVFEPVTISIKRCLPRRSKDYNGKISRRQQSTIELKRQTFKTNE